MSQWTTLSLILALGLILMGLSAEAAAAADDLPRNIALKPGAAVSQARRARSSPSLLRRRRLRPLTRLEKPDTPKEGEGVSVAAPAPAPAEPADKATPPEDAPACGKPAEAAATLPPGPSPVELKPRELALAVQTELKRVGCYPGSIDGV